jgi:predicted transcriptional regulator of viral defense system
MPRPGIVSTEELAKRAQRGDWAIHRERERAVAAVAEAQHGIVTLPQLRAVGFSESGVRYRVDAGKLRRLHRGVYAIPGLPLTAKSHGLAAVVACGHGAVLSHTSAAALWGIRASAATLVDVTVPSRAGRRREGIRVHRGGRLIVNEIDEVAGIPCTAVARTVVDCAAYLSESATEYLIHQAQIKRLLRRSEVEAVLQRNRSRAGTAVVRRILGLSLPGDEKVRSVNERRFLRICRDAELPPPEVDAWIPLPEGHGLRVDFAWPQQRLIVEVDSRTYHGTDRSLINDPGRDRRLMLAGWRVVRFSYRDLSERPALVATELRRLMALGPFRRRN